MSHQRCSNLAINAKHCVGTGNVQPEKTGKSNANTVTTNVYETRDVYTVDGKYRFLLSKNNTLTIAKCAREYHLHSHELRPSYSRRYHHVRLLPGRRSSGATPPQRRQRDIRLARRPPRGPFSGARWTTTCVIRGVNTYVFTGLHMVTGCESVKKNCHPKLR